MRKFCFYQYFVPNGTFVFGKRLLASNKMGLGKELILSAVR